MCFILKPDFQNWAAGGKNEQETKNCAMLQENPVGQWYNAHCSEEKHLGICEQEAIPSTDPPTTETPNATSELSNRAPKRSQICALLQTVSHIS